jgi:hypothetical protein
LAKKSAGLEFCMSDFHCFLCLFLNICQFIKVRGKLNDIDYHQIRHSEEEMFVKEEEDGLGGIDLTTLLLLLE